jgi:cytochrome c553
MPGSSFLFRHLMAQGRAGLAAGALLAAALPAAQANDAERVNELIQTRCFVCHGLNGESSTPAFPRLAGQHAVYTTRQLADFKSGRRRSDSMKPMVEDLSDKDFELLGAFFAAQPAQAHAGGDAALVEQGKQLYVKGKGSGAACATCHGPAGHGAEYVPRLAGQHAQYLVKQMQSFKDRERPAPAVLAKALAGLNEREVQALAAYLSGLK